MLFFLETLVFIVCIIIQFMALHRRAFGRSMFITFMMFTVSFMFVLSPKEIAIIFYQLFLYGAWAFVLFMTWQSVRRFRQRRNEKEWTQQELS